MGNYRSTSYYNAIEKIKNISISTFYDINILNESTKDYEIMGMSVSAIEYYAKEDLKQVSYDWNGYFNGYVHSKDDKKYIQMHVDLNSQKAIKLWLTHKFELGVNFELEFDNKKIQFKEELIKWINSYNYDADVRCSVSTDSKNIIIKSHVSFTYRGEEGSS